MDDDWSMHLELNLAQNGVAKTDPLLGLQQLFDVRSCEKHDLTTYMNVCKDNIAVMYDVTMNWQLECGLTGVRVLNASFFLVMGHCSENF